LKGKARDLREECPIVPRFIAIPASFQVHPNDVARWAHIQDFNVTQIQHQTQRVLAKVARGGSVRSYAINDLISASHDERMDYLLDAHLTREGHRVTADHATPIIQRLINSSLRENSMQTAAVSEAFTAVSHRVNEQECITAPLLRVALLVHQGEPIEMTERL
jgi:hypothetical protein